MKLFIDTGYKRVATINARNQATWLEGDRVVVTDASADNLFNGDAYYLWTGTNWILLGSSVASTSNYVTETIPILSTNSIFQSQLKYRPANGVITDVRFFVSFNAVQPAYGLPTIPYTFNVQTNNLVYSQTDIDSIVQRRYNYNFIFVSVTYSYYTSVTPSSADFVKDLIPVSGSDNFISSGAVYSAINDVGNLVTGKPVNYTTAVNGKNLLTLNSNKDGFEFSSVDLPPLPASTFVKNLAGKGIDTVNKLANFIDLMNIGGTNSLLYQELKNLGTPTMADVDKVYLSMDRKTLKFVISKSSVPTGSSDLEVAEVSIGQTLKTLSILPTPTVDQLGSQIYESSTGKLFLCVSDANIPTDADCYWLQIS